MGVAVFGEGEGGESGGAGYAGVRVAAPGTDGGDAWGRANFFILKLRDFACFCGSKYVPSM